MPGLVPGIHVLAAAKEGVDGRVKPGHDGKSIRHLAKVLSDRQHRVPNEP
jgi:hypothetical protein